MTRIFANSSLILGMFLFFGVNPSFQANVSPKVDFIEDKDDLIPPKIQGVRVIVDATKLNGGKMDDKTETIRIQTDGAKQTVGIHTDITFEIDKNSTKSTDGRKAESDEDNDDTEVPIYRGSHTEGDRNNIGRRRDPNDYYMHHNQPNNFHGVNDEDRYGDAGTWVRFLPMANGAWTTERYSETFPNPQNRRFPSGGFVPYGIGQKSLRPCICDDRSMWRDVNRRSFGPSTSKPQGTDDKLEYPFSETD